MTSFLSQIWIQRLGWSLLHFLWQGTAIAVLHAVVRYGFARRASAHARYVLACASLLALTIAPPLTFVLLSRAGSIPEAAPWVVSVGGWAGSLPIVVAVWLAGVFGFSLRLLGACRMTKRLRLASHPAPSEWQARVDAIAAEISKRMRAVKLLVSPMVHVPTVIGHLRPAILVPVTFLTGLPADQIEALLAHELAHIRRNDYLVSVLQSVAEVVLFYHPAVWWISGQIREEREFCCDDLAVSAGVDVLTYSRALATLETARPSFRLQPAANGGSLLGRIRRLVGTTHQTANAMPGAATAWAMVALWVIGAGVTTAHGGPTGTLLKSRFIGTSVQPAGALAPKIVPVNPDGDQAAKTLLFDPVFSAQMAQTPPPPGLSTDAKPAQRLVVERVSAVDSSGKRIEGIRQTDLMVTEDDAPQSIAFFEYENTDRFVTNARVSPLATAQALPALTPATLAVETPGQLLYKDHRLVVLYFDASSMTAQDQVKAFDAASRFVSTQMASADAVAIMRYASHGSELVQDFTGDRARLLAVLATMAGSAAPAPAASRAAEAEFGAFSPDARVRALGSAVTSLGALSEKKALVYISGGLNISGGDNRAQLRAAENAAVRAGVQVFPVDGRVPVAGAREITGHDALTSLATDTAGQALLDGADLAGSIGAVVKSLGSYYVVAYRSTGGEGEGKLHRVNVALNTDSTATLTYARAYYAEKQTGQVEGDKEKQLEEVSASGVPVTTIPVAAEVDSFRLNHAESNVPVTIRIPGSELVLAKQADSDKTTIDYLLQIRDEQGTIVSTVRDSVVVQLTASAADDLAKRSVTYTSSVTLLPGLYSLSGAVLDEATNNVGTYNGTFRIANLEKDQGLPLTSVVLSNKAPYAPRANVVNPSRAPAANPLIADEQRLAFNASHVFSANGSMYVYLQAYEKGAANTVPLTAHLSFYKGQANMLESTSVTVSDGMEPKSQMLLIRMEVPLASLAPGEYECQLTVLDPATGKSAVSRQTVSVVQ